MKKDLLFSGHIRSTNNVLNYLECSTIKALTSLTTTVSMQKEAIIVRQSDEKHW